MTSETDVDRADELSAIAGLIAAFSSARTVDVSKVDDGESSDAKELREHQIKRNKFYEVLMDQAAKVASDIIKEIARGRGIEVESKTRRTT